MKFASPFFALALGLLCPGDLESECRRQFPIPKSEDSVSTLLFLSANKIIFRRWREEWQSTASRTGIIRVPSTVFSPDTSTYDKVTGTRTLQRKGVNPPLCPAYFVRPRGSPPRHRRIHGTQRGHRPPYFKTKSCADTRPIQDRYISCAKTFDRTSGPIRELPLGSCPTKMGRGIGSSLVGATKQHFRIGPTARSKVSRREICLYYHGHTQDMGDAPLADMLLSKVGSMGAAPKRIGCPGLVGVQASN